MNQIIECEVKECIYNKKGKCKAEKIKFSEDGDYLICQTYERDKKVPWECKRCGGDLLDCQCI